MQNATSAPKRRRAGLHLWALCVILGVGVGVRLIGLRAPLLDTYGWRQCETAMMARNYHHHGYRLFWPELNVNGRRPNWIGADLPVYAYGVALLYAVCGEHELLGRLLNVLLFVPFGYLLWLLGSRAYGPAAGLWSAAVVSLLPGLVFFGRTYQPDMLMLLLATFSVYALWVGTEGDRPWLSALSGCALGLAAAIKPPILHVLLPAAYLWWKRHGFAFLRRPEAWLWLALAAAPSVLWFFHAAELTRLSGSGFAMSDPSWMLALDQWRGSLIGRMLTRLLVLVVTPVGTLLVAVSLLKRTGKAALLPHLWLLAALISTALLLVHNVRHHYYQLPLYPPVALLIGGGVALIVTNWVRGAILAVLLIVGTLPAAQHVAGWYNWQPDIRDCGVAVQEVTPPSGLVVSVSPEGHALPFYCNRNGFHGFVTLVTPEDLEEWRRRGAETLAIAPGGYWTSMRADTARVLRRDWILSRMTPQYRVYRSRAVITP